MVIETLRYLLARLNHGRWSSIQLLLFSLRRLEVKNFLWHYLTRDLLREKQVTVVSVFRAFLARFKGEVFGLYHDFGRCQSSSIFAPVFYCSLSIESDIIKRTLMILIFPISREYRVPVRSYCVLRCSMLSCTSACRSCKVIFIKTHLYWLTLCSERKDKIEAYSYHFYPLESHLKGTLMIAQSSSDSNR